MIALIFGQVLLMRELNYWNKNFYDALQNLDQVRFTKELIHFLLIAALYFVVLKNLKLFLTNYLQIKWRKELTDVFTNLWVQNKHFLKLDHPEQRITEDINELTALTLQFGIKIISETTLILLFSLILFKISPELFYLNILLFIMSLILAIWFGAPLTQVNYEQQQKESAFRYLMTFLRVHHFEIQKAAPAKSVKADIQNHFQEVESNFHKKNFKTTIYEVFLNIYQQLCYIIPFFKLAPQVFEKSLTLGDLFQSTSAFAQVNSSTNYFIESYALVSRWISVHKRLKEYYLLTVSEAKNSSIVFSESENGFEASNLILLNSHLQTIKKFESVKIKKGQMLLISGPNASGKSTFVNTLMGLWPHFQGTIQSAAGKILFISSESLLKSPTSLAEYFDFFGVSDEDKVRALFDVFDLKLLAEKPWREIADYSTQLSQGQKQKLRFLLSELVEHDTLILDEALCFVPAQEEIDFIFSYQKRHPKNTLIVISHNQELTSQVDSKLLF